jgi:hypothetical protein
MLLQSSSGAFCNMCINVRQQSARALQVAVVVIAALFSGSDSSRSEHCAKEVYTAVYVRCLLTHNRWKQLY